MQQRSSTVPVPMTIGLASLRRQMLTQESDQLLSASLQAINFRLAHIESIWADFENSWKCLVASSATEDKLSASSACYEEGENIYLNLKTQFLERIDTLGSSSASVSTDSTHIVQLAEPIKVPKFSGQEEDWGIYRQAFHAIVHSNPRLNNAQKLLKLLESLEGRAKQAVGSYWSTADDRNFDLAWTALCRQYDNEYGIIRAHLRKIYALKPMQEASCDGLRNVLDTVRGAQRQLQLILPPEKVADYILLHHVEQILDPVSLSDWSLKRTTTELPSLENIYEYLEIKSATLAGMSKTTSATKHTEELRRQSSTKGSATTTLNNRGRISEDRPRCDLCPNQFHWPFKCDKFRSLQMADRKAYILGHGMCINCFSRKHEADKCPDRACPRCNKHHNSLLCSAIKKLNYKPERLIDVATSSSTQ